MSGKIQVLLFALRHLARVQQIERASFGADAYPRSLFLDLYRESKDLFFVAKLRRRIAGYAVTGVTGDEAELISIATAPESRGAGAGTALLLRTLAALRRARVGRLSLIVKADNKTAMRLYRGLGFRPVGRVKRYYEDGSDGVAMRRRV